jgi:serine/threonine-protein kinase/endoribonuclease IRE1
VEESSEVDLVPSASKALSLKTLGTTSVQEELEKAGIFIDFQNDIGSSRSSIVYDGNTNCDSKAVNLIFSNVFCNEMSAFNGAKSFKLKCSCCFLASGYYEDKSQPAAVKRIKAVDIQLYENEIKLLRELKHPNLIRYFATKRIAGVFYISMEKADCNLGQFIVDHPDDTDILIKLLHDSCLGLKALHDNDIVHRDINPSNILVMKNTNGYVGKLSDFGLSKTLPKDKSNWVSGACGTRDFMPPEVLTAHKKKQEASYFRGTDIYSLGKTMFYILSLGEHPGGVLNFHDWGVTSPPVVQFQSCIERMICPEMDNRASINFVLNHPWSWSPKKNLDFILATANVLVSGAIDREELKKKLSSDLKVGDEKLGWTSNLCPKVQSYLKNPCTSKKNPKKYDGKDFSKLIELIRDKDQHFPELPNDLKSADVFGDNQTSYIRYFTERFPGLIPTLYAFLEERKVLPCFKCFYD